MICQDAEKLFGKGEGKRAEFERGKKRIECWDMTGFEMEGAKEKVRVVRYCEHVKEKIGKESVSWMWLATTSEGIPYETLWKMMHKRWDIEENAFHQLKTYYHAKHGYCHEGLEVVLYLMLLAFNSGNCIYTRGFMALESGITRKSVNRIFSDNLQTEDLRELLYATGG